LGQTGTSLSDPSLFVFAIACPGSQDTDALSTTPHRLSVLPWVDFHLAHGASRVPVPGTWSSTKGATLY